MAPPAHRRRTLLVGAVTLPPLALAALGLAHPHDLTAADAGRWRDLHVVGLVLFPLLGIAPWLVLRRVAPRAALVAAVLGYVYATCYTALDVLAGIGAGALAVVGRGGQGVLFRTADAIVLPGVVAYLVAAALAGALLVPRRPRIAVPGTVLVVAGAVSFLSSHVFPPRGVLTMLALAAGWTLLAIAQQERRG